MAGQVRLVVGLGNPGRRYQRTRHNAGFMVIEELRGRCDAGEEIERAGGLRCQVQIAGQDVVLLRPIEYMNRSGPPVRAALERDGAGPEEALVICDDLWLPFGSLRLRRSGSHGGHNGLRSIIDSLGSTEFPRLRVGIGPAEAGVEQADFVLEPFRSEEWKRMGEVIGAAADAVEAVLRDGIDAAMNRTNRRPDAGATEE